MRKSFIVALLSTVVIAGCNGDNSHFAGFNMSGKQVAKTYAYTDKNAPVEARVDDLVSKLTLDEKITLLGGTGFTTEPIERLGIPAFKMSDGPVGARNDGLTTAYPAGIGLAASFDIDNAKAIGNALGRDCRSRGVHILLGPGMDMYRSPLAGRNFEYFGEDPILTAAMATGYVEGLQSQRVSATIKHFAANEQEFDRHQLDSTVDERTLREIYLRPFQICIEQAHPWMLMTSYNPVNGVHASQNHFLLTDILKGEWQFPGYVMSDWTSCYDTIGMATGGLDLEMPKAVFYTKEKLMPLIKNNIITEAVIDDKVRRLFRVAFNMGWMDKPQKDDLIPADDPANNKVALEGARGSLTLLKNDGNFFPLDKNKVKSIVLVGPEADPAVVSGGGSGAVHPFHPVSILQGLTDVSGGKIKITRIPWTPPGLGREMTHMVPSSKTWKAEYFTNDTLSGAPTVTRDENFIDYDWKMTKTPAKEIPHDHFSARWTGTVTADKDGAYIFACSSDDGSRVFLDGKEIIEQWSNHATTELNATINLKAGEEHKVVVEYYNGALGAEIHFGWGAPKNLLPDEYKDTIKNADVVLACMGFNDNTGASVAYEGEGIDRPYGLPEMQLDVLRRTFALNPHTAVLLTSGGAVDVSEWLDKTPALFMTWYPGSNGGTAIAEAVFGEISPSGKLPFTWEHTLADYPASANFPSKDIGRLNTYKEGVFLGYRRQNLADKPPLFAFGYGLSYTTFDIGQPATPVVTGDAVTVTVPVKNTGAVAGAQVVQLYVTPPQISVPRPNHELKAFAKVMLAPGESKTVELSFPKSALGYWDPNTKAWTVSSGSYTLYAASSSVELGASTTLTLP